ncbi:metal-dependent hydrolase [Clostridium nigeriense]|uniref:metal-dependent hydrolase n=1 Tax=Clostridium nigeriense TaxID=1805470 RepID=UPI0008307D60|nr:metal-dependent hydrolase [Clostridium nigeriense]
MKGREHLAIGITATSIMGLAVFNLDKNQNLNYFIPLISGSIIGSYLPDIDAEKSKASQTFNKVLVIALLLFALVYKLNITNRVVEILPKVIVQNKYSLYFIILMTLGKLSPHRMFTHKWFGTMLFFYTIYNIGIIYLTLGFIMGYTLHIVGDRFSTNGKHLNFFEFKLPCMNSKNKFSIKW